MERTNYLVPHTQRKVQTLKLQLGYRVVGAASEVMPWLWVPLSPQEIINKEITTAKHFVWTNNDTLSSLTAWLKYFPATTWFIRSPWTARAANGGPCACFQPRPHPSAAHVARPGLLAPRRRAQESGTPSSLKMASRLHLLLQLQMGRGGWSLV